jgi:cell division protein FtsW
LFAGGVAPFYLAILAVAILVGISAVMVVSASSGEAVLRDTVGESTMSAFAEGLNNLGFILAGALIAFGISRADYRRYASLSFPLLIITVAALVYLLIFVDPIMGARRWLFIGPISVQPSELAKPVLLVFSAYVLALQAEVRERGSKATRSALYYLIPALVVGATLLCIVFQPDLGTTSIIVIGMLVVYMMSGTGLRFLTFLVPVALGLYLFRAFSLGNYQVQRIQSLVHGLIHGQYSHQVTQGMYALGSGGLFGVGLGLSRQKYFYVPEAQNDFILAIIGEEMGLLGTLMVVGAFALLMWAGFSITLGARDRLGRVLAAGATTMLITQAVINMVAVVGLGPVTGKPLPFVTLGGSAMISSFILLGIILSVARFSGEPREDYRSHDSLYVGFSTAVVDTIERGLSKRERKAPRPRIRRGGQDEGGDEDEGDFEWRWDSRSRLSGAGAGRAAS